MNRVGIVVIPKSPTGFQIDGFGMFCAFQVEDSLKIERWGEVSMSYVEKFGGSGRILSPKMTGIRCFDRTDYVRAVLVRVIESVSGFESLGRTVNFSIGGVLFESRDLLEVTALIELRIPTQYGVAVADAVVVFVNRIGDLRFQIGVKFVRLLPEDRSRLKGEAQGLNRRIESSPPQTYDLP